jgi:PAS domain S-box-containing protein
VKTLPWSPRSVWQGLALILVPSFIVVGLQIYQMAKNVPELKQNQDFVAHMIDVISTTKALERAIQDAERGQRGFLITGNPAYLEPYTAGVSQVSDTFSRLKLLTADSPEQQRRWPILEQQIYIKLDELKRTIDVRRNQGFDAARQIVETNVGADAMRQIDQIIDAAEADETGMLQDRQALGDETERTTAIVSLIEAVFALLIVIAGAVLVSNDFRRISRSERAVIESEDRFRLLVSGIKDYAIFMLDPDGCILLWNDGAERLKGYKADEIIGRHFSTFYPAGDVQADIPDQELRTALDEGSVTVEGWRIRKDGSRFWANVLITPIRNRRGMLQGFVKLARDLTERKASEAALARETEERLRLEGTLRQVQKMDVLGQLTGGIAHDFNNMLGVIIGSLEVLQRRLQTDDPRILGPIRSAMQASERSAALTHGLLAFTRQQPLEPKPIDANKLVTSMSSLLNRTLGESIEIETVLAAGLWTTLADPNQLENALLNLAVNARDAMPDGGKLTIETGNTHLDEAYASAHAEVTSGQYVMIAITDTGSGMSVETIEKAFEPFFTTKELGRGTGLGLSQVYGFVKQSAGHIKIYSELGEGTTVKLYLPRPVGNGATIREESGLQALPAHVRTGTILFVEDNDLLLASVAAMLREQGYRVLTAPDAEVALQLLDAAQDVRLLFTDVGLPGGMNGRQLADEARYRRPDLLVLFTTGYTRNAIIHQGRLDPGVEFIGKPFTYAALLARIQRLLEQ